MTHTNSQEGPSLEGVYSMPRPGRGQEYGFDGGNYAVESKEGIFVYSWLSNKKV